ncbi:hypothetical protein IFM89_028335 [Coptis chinensis]|uniref:Uncharacterized protein n=1 Tax=Coptis chinensis TaxID=261450 RepID=A0A835I443_9MAGN|nr:hypothetical protein IFM89_028335 [Coptis chinensis]
MVGEIRARAIMYMAGNGFAMNPNLTDQRTQVQASVARPIGEYNYHKKYILTGSPDPIFHVCFGGMIFSYLVALPEERRHLAHAQEHAAH